MSARASTAGSERRNVPPETGISRLLMNILRFQVLHSQSSSARLSIRSQPFPPAARGITESETAQAPSLYLDYSACPSQVAKKTKHKPPLFSPARTTTAPRVQLYILPYKRRRVRRSAGRYCAFCFVVSSLCVGPRRFFFYLC